MNQTINLLQNHVSVREYKETELTNEQVMTIIKCAQMAPTSSFLQTYSIIGVKDKKMKEKLAELAGNQEYVAKNGHFFVFCADYYRHTVGAKLEGHHLPLALESTEKFLVGAVDAALAAQNAVIAAESMGLGTVYIGGIRNNIAEVSELLQLPKYVIPIVGLAVGSFEQKATVKPRLPLTNVYHENIYEQNEETITNDLQSYNEVISAYYHERTNGKRKDRWTEQTTKLLSKERRQTLKSFLGKKGFLLD